MPWRRRTTFDPEPTPDSNRGPFITSALIAAQFGLVAEEVEKVNPDLVARDETGKAYTVRYEAVNAMLLNEFLKEHRKIQEQEARLTKQGAAIAEQEKQIEALAAGLQKVTARVELSNVRRVANDQ